MDEEQFAALDMDKQYTLQNAIDAKQSIPIFSDILTILNNSIFNIHCYILFVLTV